jgi:hypothetical protein
MPIHEVDGCFVNARDEEDQSGRDSDPDPALQVEVLADSLAQMINLLRRNSVGTLSRRPRMVTRRSGCPPSRPAAGAQPRSRTDIARH